ncbi:hypothetical protein [Noviherbaspirillum aerium]|uniref:hypothetical protein n=1 Tax=Noviherbaspirillum aerium TaxID=2588497 RepID=UPI00124E5416|nr:hypothetical protein [Noviherbaspirillum aerium]
MRKYNPANRSQLPAQVSARQRCLPTAAILFCMLIFLAAMPDARAVLSSLAGEKLLRFVAYALLSTLLYAGVSGSTVARALITLTLVGVMSGVEQAIHLMLPYHSANLLGWKFDMLVALTCVGMLMMLHPVFAERSTWQQIRPARIPTRSSLMRQLHERGDRQ